MFYGVSFGQLRGYGAVVDPQVEEAQNLLRQLGFKGADGAVLKVDGEWGRNTNAALTTFYAAQGKTWGCTSNCRSKLTPAVIAELNAALLGTPPDGSAPDRNPMDNSTMLAIGAGVLALAIIVAQARQR